MYQRIPTMKTYLSLTQLNSALSLRDLADPGAGPHAMQLLLADVVAALGLDRALMLRKGIPDIRLLRSADPRVAGQMLDLSAYRPVSALPAARRDLSLAVGAGTDDEILGDRVRDALGAEADLVEEVTVLSTTPYDDLPAAARERLGKRSGHDNVLVRVVLRAMDRTLTADEVNGLRDRIYDALHEGDRLTAGVLPAPSP
jgi:phenylalanyl-tRNA synthetase alpha chain